MPDKAFDDQVLDVLRQGFGVSESHARTILAFYRDETQGDDQIVEDLTNASAQRGHAPVVHTNAATIHCTPAGAPVAFFHAFASSHMWPREPATTQAREPATTQAE